jgi:hypothetical protein
MTICTLAAVEALVALGASAPNLASNLYYELDAHLQLRPRLHPRLQLC